MEVHGIHGVMGIIIIGYVHTIMEGLEDIIKTFLILGVGGAMVIIIHFIIAIIIITARITPYLDFGHANLAILEGILFLFSSEFLSDIF